MTKLVLLHKSDSIYDDVPDRVYDFPRSYLKAVEEGVGDWAVYYEPVKAGGRGYFAVAKIQDVMPKPGAEGRYFANIQPGTYLDFDRDVPRILKGRIIESALSHPDGSPKSGGAQQRAVRRLHEAEFATIVRYGLPGDLEELEALRYRQEPDDFNDPSAPIERPVIERLLSRPYRDIAFRRKVRAAYDYRCAISGLQLRNGGGRPEVEAAHIRPVQHNGSDFVRNGLALSATLHWMFDRGLLAVADDDTILVSKNKVPPDAVDRLLHPSGKLIKPANPQNWPHPENLKWHRVNVFGQGDALGAVPWEA